MIRWHNWNCETTPDDVFAWRQSGRNVESQASGVVIANRRFAAANGGRSRLWPVDETSVEIQVPEDSAPEAGRGGLEEKPAGERFLLQLLYDAAGNMTGKHLYNSQTALNSIKDVTYAYNYQDAMTEVRVANQVIASYQYDTNKQRIYSDTHYAGVDETTIYHWDMSGHIIGEETVPSGTTWYIYAGNNKIAMLRTDPSIQSQGDHSGIGTEKLYFFINDLQGTPVLITDTSGNIVQKIQLDPYGNVERALGIFPDEINYTGKKLDPVTGLYYFNQRYYDPELGRFLSHDPAHQRLNPYHYCDNNPLSNIDPDGLWSIGFNFFGFGFHLGDREIGFRFFGMGLDLDFKTGKLYGVLGVDFNFNRIGIGGGYRIDLSNGQVTGYNYLGLYDGNGILLDPSNRPSIPNPVGGPTNPGPSGPNIPGDGFPGGGRLGIAPAIPLIGAIEGSEILLGALAGTAMYQLLDDASDLIGNIYFGGKKEGKKGSKNKGVKIPNSEEIHTNHQPGPYKNGHKHWREQHTDPSDPTKTRIIRKTGPLEE